MTFTNNNHFGTILTLFWCHNFLFCLKSGMQKMGISRTGVCVYVCVYVYVRAWPIEFQSSRQKFVCQTQLALTFKTSEFLIARPGYGTLIYKFSPKRGQREVCRENAREW